MRIFFKESLHCCFVLRMNEVHCGSPVLLSSPDVALVTHASPICTLSILHIVRIVFIRLPCVWAACALPFFTG